MKKLIALLLLLLALPVCAQADVNLSGMSFDELVLLRDQINLAIWNSQEWQEVTVPQGLWQVGVDIPAGHWTITAADGAYSRITYGDTLDDSNDISYRSNDRQSDYVYSKSSVLFKEGSSRIQMDIDMKNNYYVQVEQGNCVFTPYIGKPSLGFSKNGEALASPTATPIPVVNGYPALDFSKISRNPEKYIDTKAFASGRVVQVIGSRKDGYELRFAVDGDSNKMIYLVIFPGEAMPESNILDEDNLEVFLTLRGDYSYETVLGATVTLPLAFVDSLKNLSE